MGSGSSVCTLPIWYFFRPSSFRLRRHDFFRTNELTDAALSFNLRTSGDAESVSAHGKLFGQFSIAQNFDAGSATVGQAGTFQHGLIHARALFEPIQCLEIHWQVPDSVARVVKTTLGNTAD